MTRLRLSRGFVAGALCGIAAVFAIRFTINSTAFADLLISPLLVPDTSGPADAIVAMGAGVTGECVPNLNGTRRVLLAARLWRERRAAVLVMTGGPDREQSSCTVADAMARLARDVGVPEASIRIEKTSQSTHENGALTAPLLRREGVQRVLIVTDRLHMPRATGVFARHGFDVERASVPVYEGHVDNVDMLAAGLREMAALALYRMRGWIAPERARNASQPLTNDANHSRSLMRGAAYPHGPIVILGASYAGGWRLEAVNGIPVINRGVGGELSFEMLARFDRDVVPERPRAVILWGFINDIFQAQDMDRSLSRVQESYIQLVDVARRSGIEPILATEVTIRAPDSWTETLASWVGRLRGKESYQDRINRHVMALNRWLVDLARREQLLVLDVHGAMADSTGQRRREFVRSDGSHITPAGYDALTAFVRPVLVDHITPSTNDVQR